MTVTLPVRRHGPPSPGRRLPELSRVVLLRAARTLEGDDVPPGTEGTVVGVIGDGVAYDVEFADALGPATVAADAVRSA